MSEVVNELRFLFTIMTLTIKLKLTATSLFTVTNVPIEGYLTELRCNHFSLLDKMNVFFFNLEVLCQFYQCNRFSSTFSLSVEQSSRKYAQNY